MFYSLKRIFHNIKKHLGVYLIFILEFALGLGMFLGCYSMQFAAEQDLQKAMDQQADSDITVNYVGISALLDRSQDPYADFPVQYEKYLKLKDELGDVLEIRYAPYSLEYLAEEDNWDNNCSFYLFFANDAFFEDIFHTEMKRSVAYMGTSVLPQMTELVKNHNSFQTKQYIFPEVTFQYPYAFLCKNGELMLSCSGEALEIEPLPSTEITEISHPNGQDAPPFELSSCVFISIDYYPEYEKMYKGEIDHYDKIPEAIQLEMRENFEIGDRPLGINSVLGAGYIEKNDQSLLMLLNLLNSADSCFDFSANQDALQMQGAVQTVKGIISNYQKTSIGLLAVVVLGNIGIMLILMNQRKKSIAISCAYGATRGRIALEIFAELLIVALIGMAVALIGLHYAEPLLQKIYLNTKADVTAGILIGLIFSLITALIPTVAAVHKLRKIEISSTLKSL